MDDAPLLTTLITGCLHAFYRVEYVDVVLPTILYLEVTLVSESYHISSVEE